MKIALLVTLLALTSPLAVYAQEQTPAKVPNAQEKVPRIDPEAVAALDAMMARYGAMHSYSDRCEVKLENGERWPKEQHDRMTLSGTLAFERPAKLRFEGTSPTGAFLLVNDGATTRILNAERKGEWLERPQGASLNVRDDFSRANVGPRAVLPMPIDAGWVDVGVVFPSMGFIFRQQIVRDERDMVIGTTFGEDETINGEECRVVRIETDYGAGSPIETRLWMAKSDGLLRRFRRTFGEGDKAVVMTETRSDVRPDAELPSTTWGFAAPTNAKATDHFPDPYPVASNLKFQIGDTLPVFSQDGLGGEAVELNPKGGGVTLVYFFFANLATSDGDSLQRLQTALNAKGLHLVAAAGDAKRERVQALISRKKWTFPIYFDDKAFRNQLAQAMGVRGWPLVLLFDRDAKLRAIAQRPGDAEFVQALRQLFPDVSEQTVVGALMGPPPKAP